MFIITLYFLSFLLPLYTFIIMKGDICELYYTSLLVLFASEKFKVEELQRKCVANICYSHGLAMIIINTISSTKIMNF